MSRGSIRTFLITAKRHLYQSIKNNGHISFVLGNESADLDSITCALLYSYIQSSRPQAQRAGQLFIPVTNIPAADLSLRPELTTLLRHAAIQPSELITLDDLALDTYPAEQTSWILVDHNAFQGALGQRFGARVAGVIDHHDDEQHVQAAAQPRTILKSGSCSSLVTNHCREAWQAIANTASSVGAAHGQDDKLVDDAAYTRTWDAQLATLLLGSILIDTINLQDPHKTTDHDRSAVRFLEALVQASRQLGAAYDRDALFREVDAAKSDLDALSLYDILRKDYKQWSGEDGLTLGVAAVVQPLEYLRGKDGEDFNATLVRFARDRKLPLVAVMTAYSNEDGDFQRELLLVALEDGKAKEAAARFVAASKDELQLEDVQIEMPSDAAFAQAWRQRNLAASRKQVAPLLRSAMRS